MCVRYLKPEELKEVQKVIDQLGIEIFRVTPEALVAAPKGEACPGSLAPIVGQGRILCQGKWGFSKWDGKGLVFNARRESLETSAFFKTHLLKGRCLVPALAYFEWEHLQGNRRGRKFSFRSLQNDGLLYMAGLARRSPQHELEYTVITRPAAENIRDIHDRMPLLMTMEEGRAWLSLDWNRQALECHSINVTADSI